MRIGLIAQRMSRLNGGVSESARLASEALIAHGYRDVVLFSADDSYLDEDARSFSVPLRRARSFGTPRYGLAPGMVSALLGARLDILHVHGLWTFHAFAAWLWHRLTGRPYVVTPHGMLEQWILQRSPRLKSIISRSYQLDLLARAASIQVLTEKEVNDVKALLPDAHCDIVPNYVPANDDQALGPPAWWRDGDADKTIYLFLGRLHEKKGCVELCEAWAEFNARTPEVAARSLLVFCGWIDGIPDFESRVSTAGALFENARFAGPQYGDEKRRSLHAAQFMLLPSKSEGLPMTILEGWSAGIPSLMTKECNLDIGFQTGASIEIGTTPESILNGLLHAASLNTDDRAAMSRSARDLIAERYSSEAFADRMIDIYRTALGRCQR